MAKKNKKDDEPAWLDPANDRKTPYTEEELNLFVEGFINDNEDVWDALVEKQGRNSAIETIKNSFRKKDERHIANIKIDNTTIN